MILGEPESKELESCETVQSVDFCLKCKAEWRLWFLSRPTQVAVLWLSVSLDKGRVDVYVIMAGFKERLYLRAPFPLLSFFCEEDCLKWGLPAGKLECVIGIEFLSSFCHN